MYYEKKSVILIVGIVVLFLALIGAVIFGISQKEAGEDKTQSNGKLSLTNKANTENEADNRNGNASLPIYYVEDMNALNDSPTDISAYYCRYCDNSINTFTIDDANILWGSGQNGNGQLGIGSFEEVTGLKGQKIAEKVLSVSASRNGYFTIFLTEDGKLYGMGSNRQGLLGQPYIKECAESEYVKVESPVLLMEEVSYACADTTSITALKKDGSVWWWGECRLPGKVELEYKMVADKPQKMVDGAFYITAGNGHFAAVTRNGELYTWGLNQYGQCGVEGKKEELIREPVKVLDNVDMIWAERIGKEEPKADSSQMMKEHTRYEDTLFVRMKDGRILACGKDLSYSYSQTASDSDGKTENTYTVSKTFTEVTLQEFPEQVKLDCLNNLKEGMDKSEVKKVLDDNGLFYTEILGSREGTGEDELVEIGFSVEEDLCRLFFDEEDKLERIE